MTNISSYAGRASRATSLRRRLNKGLAIAAIQLSLCATAFGNVIYTSGGYDDARNCASSSDCVRNGRISDARQSGSEVASGFRLDSAVQITGLSWIGDHFDGDRFVFRLYGASDGRPSTSPLYEFAIGSAFTSAPLVASPGFLSGWQLSADLAPITLQANTPYFASLSVLGDATSVLTYSWDLGKNSLGTSDFRRDDFTSGAWESAGDSVAAYQLAGRKVDVPEPMTLALLAPGLGLIWLSRRRRRSASQ